MPRQANYEAQRIIQDALPGLKSGEGVTIRTLVATTGLPDSVVRAALRRLARAGEGEQFGVFDTGAAGRPLLAWRRTHG
jgi:hypothetical protein